MRDARTNSPSDASRDPCFHTTRWSMVLAAGGEQQVDSEAALATLCQTYWYPVYAFLHRHVGKTADAQDLTQEFFARLLEKKYLARVDRRRGRFRTFLLTAVQRFLFNEQARSRAQKRGGGRKVLSLDFSRRERGAAWQIADTSTPEQEFDRQWARLLLDTALERLHGEYARSGKEPLFAELKPLMTQASDADSYPTVAARLGMSAGAVKTALYRMRKRYRDLLQDEIAQTVTHRDDVQDEMRSLFEALG